MNWKDEYKYWLTNTAGNKEISDELASIANESPEIEDRFYCNLEFGTGGLRGVIGAGTNRMNIYTVAKATQGYSNYLKTISSSPSVSIAYDSRIHSDLFAETAACVFAANNIKVFIYPKLMPTPALSFAVRDLDCSGGIVITASHNPSKYNGYKVYGSDGCQITTEAANAIQIEIDKIDPFTDVEWADFDEKKESGAIRYIGDDTVDRYLAAISTSSVLPKEISKDVSIVYTPLNGTGISCVPKCLKEHGFSKLTLVEEQKMPDGGFPTCPYPNPEIREALELGLHWAEMTNSDLLLATDPDCDRVGAAVKNGEEYTLISGNEMGILLLDFVCKMRNKNKSMPERPVAVKTIVTTPMAEKVAKKYGVELRNVLTGFKYIGEQIGLLEQDGEESRYIFGFEESYGYLSGSFVRDKDAVNASLLICEMFAYYKASGKSLVDVLNELYREFGYYGAKLLTYTFEGLAGLAKMQSLMNRLRDNPLLELAGIKVESVKDYIEGIDNLPKSNVMRYLLCGGMEAVIRPSGTEPKLKVYLTSTGSTKAQSESVLSTMESFFNEWVEE